MAYRSLPKFDPSATFLATARLPVFNGVRFQPGEAMPTPPREPGPRRVYLRQLRQLFDLRKVDQVEPSATPQTKNRKGRIARAILRHMPGEPKPSFLSDYKGTKYCLRQRLGDGHRCFRLRPLGERHADEQNLAPDEVRPIFLRVLLDCLSAA